jgi:hypothetical protein
MALADRVPTITENYQQSFLSSSLNLSAKWVIWLFACGGVYVRIMIGKPSTKGSFVITLLHWSKHNKRKHDIRPRCDENPRTSSKVFFSTQVTFF